MKNGYDHLNHLDIYTYNLSVPKRVTLDVPNQSPPYQRAQKAPNVHQPTEGIHRTEYI